MCIRHGGLRASGTIAAVSAATTKSVWRAARTTLAEELSRRGYRLEKRIAIETGHISLRSCW